MAYAVCFLLFKGNHMWIFSTAGFFSVIENEDDHDMVDVRSRAKLALLFMIDTIAQLHPKDDPYEVQRTTRDDYPYTITIPKTYLAEWARREIMEYVNYSDFGEKMLHERGPAYRDVLLECWASSLKLTDQEGKRFSETFRDGAYRGQK